MILTFDTLFSEPLIVKAVIDRIQAQQKDTIYWQRYLDFEQTVSRTFKTYFGTQTGVTMGSVISKNGKKPLKSRRNLGSGYGEVAFLGDRFQLDNDRLDMVRELINQFNAKNEAETINTIVNYIIDDYRELLLAPHKRMDKFVGDLRSYGKASVTADDNPRGVQLIETVLPVTTLTPESGDKTNFIGYIKAKIALLRQTLGNVSVMEMTQSTFDTYILGSSEFNNAYKMILSQGEMALAAGLITETMANTVLRGIGLPPIRIIEEYIQRENGTAFNTFADKVITLLPQDKIGKMRWHTPYEITDPVPNKQYTTLSGGMFISSERTNEGRFLEYGCEWMPEITLPNRIAIIDLKNF